MNQTQSNGPLKQSEILKKLTEEELEQCRELIWAIQDPDVKAKYADEVVAVYRRQIIAHGDDEATVLEEAQRITGLPWHQIAITTILGPKQLFGPR